MRPVPAAMTQAWKAQAKTGDQRPVVRATVQRAWHNKFDYDTELTEGGDAVDRHGRGVFSSVLFGDPSAAREIRDIKRYNWARSLEGDVATCQIVLQNSARVPVTEAHQDPYDEPGYRTWSRGSGENPWGYVKSPGWHEMLVPDRLVRTYEGYGIDPTVHPSADDHLVPSGVWLIDKVTYDANGEIILDMRDVGRILLDQMVFPPVVPKAEYPLEWVEIGSKFVEGRDAQGGSWGQVAGSTKSSNDFYIGKGLTNEPYDNYVTGNGGVNGHHADHALGIEMGLSEPGESKTLEYWLSTGQESAKSKVWWQVDLKSPVNMNAVRIRPHGGPYRIYVSLKNEDGWIGKKKIPYEITTGDVDVKAGIPFVYSVLADKRNPFDAILNRRYEGVTAIRLTFTNLQEKTGEYPFFAALSNLSVYTAADVKDLSFGTGQVLKAIGNYRDYTDIIKWVCAWGGFFWPPRSTDMDFVQCTSIEDDPAGRQYLHYEKRDPVLPKGRVWGDLMKSGTCAEALSSDLFDKKPLMDIINYVRDVLGFVFFIDELGGVIWRMPNLGFRVYDPDTKTYDYSKAVGNYQSPVELGQHVRRRTSEIVTIDEEETLLNYSTTLDSRNVRERIFVAGHTGNAGVVIKGFNPFPSGLRRMAGWTDGNFKNKKETKIMADMISARQMFTYRTSKVSIPGYPKIQVDDQVRIYERVTNETYYHYVVGITSELNMEEGTWMYDLDTHWLGEKPSDAWVVKVDELEGVTKNYLGIVGVGD